LFDEVLSKRDGRAKAFTGCTGAVLWQ